MNSSDRPLGWAAALLLLGGLYAAGVGSVALAPSGDQVSTFWPAAAFAVGVVTVSPRRRWPALLVAVAVVSAAANVTAGRPAELSAYFGVANALEALVAGLVLTDLTRRRARLHAQEDVVRLVLAAVLGGITIAAGVAYAVSALTQDDGWDAARTTLTSHSAAVLVLLPVLLAARGLWAGGRIELGAQVLLTGLVFLAVFATETSSPLTFAPVLALGWAALRFDTRVLAIELAVFSVATTVLTTRGYGPFGDAFVTGSVAHLDATTVAQGYLLAAALMTLPLSVSVQHAVSLLARVSADERLFRRNFTESLVGMAFLSPGPHAGAGELVVLELNDTAVEILGGPRGDLVGRPLGGLLDLPPEAVRAVLLMLDRRLDGWRSENALRTHHGRRVTLALSLLDGSAAEPVVSAQILDVTAQHEARQQLEEAEQLTSATLDTTACIILVTELDGTIVRVNSATEEITGYPERELVGQPVWRSGVAPTDHDDLQALMLWPNRSGIPVSQEHDAVTKDGQKLRIVWNNNIVRDERGEPAYAVMTGIDVTAERTTAGLMNHLMQASFTTALVGIDTQGRITVFNSGAQHLLGLDEAEVVGTPFHRLLEPEQLLRRTDTFDLDLAFRHLVAGIGDDGELRARDWTWVRKDGSHATVSMTLSVAQDAFAAQVGYLCVARDVTEQRQGQEMLVAALDKERTAVERLRALDEAKNEFVSTVSHELRTPVTSILGYTEMLIDGSISEPSPEQLLIFDTITRNGQRLITVCNDLLTLSGLDSGNVQWRRDPVDLTTTLGPLVESIQPLLIGRRIDFVFHVPDRPVVVTGDRAQLERVVINLLSNAVKFTEDAGRVSLRLSTLAGEALIRVEDSGIGIPEDEQAELFQKFFRTSTAQNRAIQGTGLGLSIVAAIVTAHGGRIDVASAHLEGSTFTVRLPLAAATPVNLLSALGSPR